MTEQSPRPMPGLAEQIAHFATHFRGDVAVSHDPAEGEPVTVEQITDVLTRVHEIAAGLDGQELPSWDFAWYLDDDGEEIWVAAERADRERMERALVFAAGELAALQAGMNLITLRAVGLLRALKAAEG